LAAHRAGGVGVVPEIDRPQDRLSEVGGTEDRPQGRLQTRHDLAGSPDGGRHTSAETAGGDILGLGVQRLDLAEGGVRMPLIARWPGHIRAGQFSGEVLLLVDMLATFAAPVHEDLPDGAGPDNYNMPPALLGAELDKPIRPALVVQGTGAKWMVIRSGP
jgi:hypothetical protein